MIKSYRSRIDKSKFNRRLNAMLRIYYRGLGKTPAPYNYRDTRSGIIKMMNTADTYSRKILLTPNGRGGLLESVIGKLDTNKRYSKILNSSPYGSFRRG